MPVSSWELRYGGIECECEIDDSERLVDSRSRGLWIA